MKLITQRDMILGVAKRWFAQYGHALHESGFRDTHTFGNTLERLRLLDLETASAKDVADIIGNASWTDLTCDECQSHVDLVVQVGQEPDYESATASLCKECLAKAFGLSVMSAQPK